MLNFGKYEIHSKSCIFFIQSKTFGNFNSNLSSSSNKLQHSYTIGLSNHALIPDTIGILKIQLNFFVVDFIEISIKYQFKDKDLNTRQTFIKIETPLYSAKPARD